MAEVRALLARELQERPTLMAEGSHTHEMSYSRYGPGASLPRHTDEHHSELKKARGGPNLALVLPLALPLALAPAPALALALALAPALP